MEIIIKVDHDEQVKTKVEELHPEDDLHPINEVIQDLKLENDRLQKRNDLMEKALNSIACNIFCDNCLLVECDECGALSVKMELAKDTLRKVCDL